MNIKDSIASDIIYEARKSFEKGDISKSDFKFILDAVWELLEWGK